MSANALRESKNFNRPPRIQPPRIKQDEFVIPPPPRSIVAPEQNWLVSLLPVLSLGALALFSILRLVANTQPNIGSEAVNGLQLSILAVVAVIGVIIGQRIRQREHARRSYETEFEYRVLLGNKRIRLYAAQIAQIAALEHDFPEPSEWLRSVLGQESRIWERRKDEPDFMDLRVGRGPVASTIRISMPAPDFQSDLMTEALQLGDDFRYLPNAPFVVKLASDVGVSVCGKPTIVMKAVRAMLCQLASTHAPQDVQIYLIAPQNHFDQWQWMSWLPHTSRNFKGGSSELMSFSPDTTRQLMGKLGQIIDERKLMHGQQQLPHILLVVDGSNLLEEEAIFSTLLREGNQYGASVICLSSSYETAPTDCRTIIELLDEKRFVYSQTGVGANTFSGEQIDTISLQNAEYIARGLAAINLHEIGESGRIPRKVNFLEMMNADDVDSLYSQIKTKWRRDELKAGILPFPVSIGRESLVAVTQLKLDETNHGPHGVLAGTTGSGKSELLQTLVTSLALEHDPRLVTFLLIDFKGGATFDVFKHLPHTVGTVTNLDREGIDRTLKALNSEIISRQKFLRQKQVSDITGYFRVYGSSYDKIESPLYETLPHLFVIVDEFAQLAKQMPEFIQELVRIAQIGRSLGLHLILGTQNPMDVITDEMNANLQFRICLRVQNVEASRAMLRRPDAAYLPLDWRGRAYLQVGEQGVFTQFQTAYVGDPYSTNVIDLPSICTVVEPDGRHTDILELVSANASLLTKIDDEVAKPVEYSTVAKIVCDSIRKYASDYNVPKAKPILLEPLPQVLDIKSLFKNFRITGGWNGQEWLPPKHAELGAQFPIGLGRAPVGIIDDLQNRTQLPLWIHLTSDKHNSDSARHDGHVMVLGMPGSGKTMFLRTLAVSLALLHPPNELHMYFVSFSANELINLGELPHAQRVIQGNEASRVRKLFSRLSRRLRDRQTGANQSSNSPLIVVFIDQYEPFRDAYRETSHDEFELLINEGRNFGIYLVFTANSPGVVPERIRSLVPQRIVFQLNESIDYLSAVGQLVNTAELTPKGRCLWRHSPLYLCQVGIFGSDQGDSVGQREREGIRQHVLSLHSGFSPGASHLTVNELPLPIEELPISCRLRDLLNSATFDENRHINTPVGLIDDDAIRPFNLNWDEAGPHYLVVGPPRSGKSNALQSSVLAAAHLYSPAEISFILVDFGRGEFMDLTKLKHVVDHVHDPESLSNMLPKLAYELQTKPLEDQSYRPKAIAVVIDNFDLFIDELQSVNPQLITQLLELIKLKHTEIKLHVWIAGHIERANDQIVKRLLLYGSIFALVHRDSLQQVNKRSMQLPSTLLPTGRAYAEIRNRIELVQFALVEDAQAHVEEINSRIWENEARANWLSSTIEQPIGAQVTLPHSETDSPTAVNLDTDIDVAGLIDDLL